MPPGHRAAPRRHRRSSSRARLAVLATTATVVAAVGWVCVGLPPSSVAPVAELSRPARPPGVETRPVAPVRPAGAAGVLRQWDAARAAAYASGSVTSLRELYVAGAGASDVRLLRSYLRRGYRVEGMRMQLLAIRVLDHAPGRWRLRVTDRLAGGEAVGYGARVTLPRDRASTRTVLLERDGDDRWRVVSVRG